MIGIYKITSPTKKVYIGQSINVEKRIRNYKGLHHCKNQPALYNSFLKHGVEKHKFEILCECEMSELNDKERYYQDLYSVIDKNGLNCKLTKSSDRSGKHSKESIFKMSFNKEKRITSEETKLKISLAHKGVKKSEEHRAKIALANKYKNIGRKNTKEAILKTATANLKLILNTESGIFYLGTLEASKTFNMSRSTLVNKLNGWKKNNTNLIYV